MIQKEKELMGTLMRIIITDDGGEELAERAFDECKRIEQSYSRFISENELAKVNGSLGKWMKVSEEFFRLIELGEKLKMESGGAFDLSVKKLLENWGYDESYSFLNKGEEVNLGDMQLDNDGLRVKAECEIDLGALGKGYALDRMVEILSGFENFCVNAGGDIYAKGVDPNGQPWKVAFEHPENADEVIGMVEVDNFYLACSNANKRRWRDKHHLVDALRKEPAGEMKAVFVQAKSGLWADAYATMLFVCGFEKATKFLDNLSVEAMLIAPEGEIFRTEHFVGELFLAK